VTCHAYYNEWDEYAAQWLRNLIARNLIAPGEVDTRSIVEVQPDDLLGFGQRHFFAGIGGWSLAARLAGIPDDEPIWTGSCPCQPFSAAGKRRGNADERHLWPEFRRLIAECEPAVVFGEQVASKDGRVWLAGVRADLEALGYAVGAADLCAAGIGAPHIRQRLWWVADANGSTGEQGCAIDGGRHQGGDAIEGAGPCGGGVSGGLGDADISRSQGRHDRSGEGGGADQWAAGPAGQFSGVADADGNGCEGPGLHILKRRQEQTVCDAGGAGSRGFWSCFELVPCADGKARRIEPGSFPLASGVPARVGRLRAYGNSIVPQVAAEFIAAAMMVRP
jgi:DNA (cytosine-5)-methyltransferase 1